MEHIVVKYTHLVLLIAGYYPNISLFNEGTDAAADW